MNFNINNKNTFSNITDKNQLVSILNSLKTNTENILDESAFSNKFVAEKEELTRRISGNYDEKYERNILVKKYERSAAGRKFESYSEIRNIDTLYECINYLITVDINRKSYKFVDNRIRAIRLDLEQLTTVKECFRDQKHFYERKIEVLKIIVRYYTVALYKLYKEENDLYPIMEQLKKTVRSLLINDGNNEYYLGMSLIANLNDPNAFHICNCIKTVPIYLQHSLSLFYKYHSNLPFLDFAFDFMSYSVCLYYIDFYKRKMMKILKNGLNERVELQKINKIVKMDFMDTFDAFYYETEGGIIDLKVKNSRNREFKRIEVREYKRVEKYLQGEWEDFKVYMGAVKRYITKTINNTNTNLITNNTNTNTNNIINNTNLINTNTNNIINTNNLITNNTNTNTNLITNNNTNIINTNNNTNNNIINNNNNKEIAMFECLKNSITNYIFSLFYKITVTKYLSSFDCFYRILFITNNIEITADPINDRIELFQMNRSYYGKYNLYVFILNDEEYLRFIENRYKNIRKIIIINRSGNIKETNNIFYINNIISINKIVNYALYNLMMINYSKIKKFRFNELNKKEKIVYLIKNKKENYKGEIKSVLKGEEMDDFLLDGFY